MVDHQAVVRRLGQLHVPVPFSVPGTPATFYMCAYDSHAWPCRERRILDGYEPEL